MDYTTLLADVTQVKETDEQATHSLYEACKRLVDGRAARGKRYELEAIITLLVLAKLAGMKSLLGASDWIADQKERLCHHLGSRGSVCPVPTPTPMP